MFMVSVAQKVYGHENKSPSGTSWRPCNGFDVTVFVHVGRVVPVIEDPDGNVVYAVEHQVGPADVPVKNPAFLVRDVMAWNF